MLRVGKEDNEDVYEVGLRQDSDNSVSIYVITKDNTKFYILRLREGYPITRYHSCDPLPFPSDANGRIKFE